MRTIVVLLALAAVAVAAPSSPQLGDDLKSSPQKWSKTINREKKSPTIGHHQLPVHHGLYPIDSYHHGGVVPPHVHDHHLGLKPIYGHGHGYGHGYGHGHFRENEAPLDNEEGKCAKEVKEKCGQREVDETTDLLRTSDNTKINQLEEPTSNMEGKVQDNILLARVAIDNMQQTLGELEKSASARAQWKHAESKSDINLHSNIETAKRALEQVQKNFDDLHTKNHHASALKEVESQDFSHFEEMSEKERMSQWKEAIDTIQKNVEIANNIKESFKSANDKQIVEPATRHSIIMKHVENVADNKNKESELEMSASNTDVTIIKPTKSSEHEKSLRHNNDNEHLINLNMESHKSLENKKQLNSPKAAEAVEDMVDTNREHARLKLMEHDSKQQESHQQNVNTLSQKENATKEHEKAAKEVNSEILEELNDTTQSARATDHMGITKKENENNTQQKSSHDMVQASSMRREDTMTLKVEGKHAMVQPNSSEDTSFRREDINFLKEKNAETKNLHHQNKFEHHEDNEMYKQKMVKEKNSRMEQAKISQHEMAHQQAKNAEASMKSTVEEITHKNMKMQSLGSKQFENNKLAKNAETDMLFMKAADNGFSHSQALKQEIEIKKKNLQKGEKFRTFLDNHNQQVKSGNLNDEVDFSEMSMKNSGQNFHHDLSLKSNDHKQHSEMRPLSGKSAMEMSGSWRNFEVNKSQKSAYGPSIPAIPAGYGNAAGSGSSIGHGAESGSGGAVGVFPNANVRGCAVPLLLSCSPSVVSGSLAKAYHATPAAYGHATSASSNAGYATSASGYAHSSYGPAPSASGLSSIVGGYAAPAPSPYRASENMNSLRKRDIKQLTKDLKERRTLLKKQKS